MSIKHKKKNVKRFEFNEYLRKVMFAVCIVFDLK
jgi:hypothetical protein